jgi:hypothetical protein
VTTERLLVLDANILIRAVLGVRVRSLLIDHSPGVAFLTPSCCVEEVRKHLTTRTVELYLKGRLHEVHDSLRKRDRSRVVGRGLSFGGDRPYPYARSATLRTLDQVTISFDQDRSASRQGCTNPCSSFSLQSIDL